MKMWERTGSNAEHVSKQLQKYHKLADLRCCIWFFFYSHRGSSKAKKYNTCELNCEMAFTGEEMTQAVNHHLERGVCRGGERRWMGLGGLDGPLTLGTRAVWMVLLTTLNTALLWFFLVHSHEPQSRIRASLLPGTCLSSALSPLWVFHLPLLDSRETNCSLPAFVNSMCKDNVCKTK